jgi:hypothetical protein
MKIRNGFVSNSSSSSFVVEYKDYDKNGEKLLLTDEQVKLLTDFGFIPSSTTNEIAIESCGMQMFKVKKKRDIFTYIFSVICNQDDVIEFLLENDIAFKAAIHYGHQTIIYKDHKLYKYENIGLQRATYISSIPKTDSYERNPYLKKGE